MIRQRLTVVTIAAIAVAVGLLPMPGEYYGLLRIFLCGLSVYFLVQPGVPDVAKWLLVGVAVLHNPIAPVELGTGAVWAAVNLGTVGFFWLLNRRVARTPRW